MCYNVRKTPKSPTALIIVLHGGTDQAIPGLLVRLTQTHLLWHLGKRQGTTAHNFQPITLKIVKTTASCNTNKVLFGIIFATNSRSCEILPPGQSLLHLGVTSCPPSRTPYTHDVRIFYISSLGMLFDICEQCWYQRCVTSIEMGGDVLALGIRFI